MPVSPADFALWARATGNKYPETAEEKVAAAPHAYEYAKNLGRRGQTAPTDRVGGSILYRSPESLQDSRPNAVFNAPVTPDNDFPKVSGTADRTLTSEQYVNQEQNENQERSRSRQIVDVVGKTALAAGGLAAGYALSQNPSVRQAIQSGISGFDDRVSSFLSRFTTPDLNGPTTSQRYNQQTPTTATQQAVQIAKGAPVGSPEKEMLQTKPVTESEIISTSQTFGPEQKPSAGERAADFLANQQSAAEPGTPPGVEPHWTEKHRQGIAPERFDQFVANATSPNKVRQLNEVLGPHTTPEMMHVRTKSGILQVPKQAFVEKLGPIAHNIYERAAGYYAGQAGTQLPTIEPGASGSNYEYQDAANAAMYGSGVGIRDDAVNNISKAFGKALQQHGIDLAAEDNPYAVNMLFGLARNSTTSNMALENFSNLAANAREAGVVRSLDSPLPQFVPSKKSQASAGERAASFLRQTAEQPAAAPISEQTSALIPNADQPGYARYHPEGYEVSSQGDKRFSAMYAKLPSGQTIEQAYQSAKGTGKGQPAADPNFDYWGTYKGLWNQYFDANPEALNEIANASQGKVLTDKFANTSNNQARAIHEILTERGLRGQPSAPAPSVGERAETFIGALVPASGKLGQPNPLRLPYSSDDPSQLESADSRYYTTAGFAPVPLIDTKKSWDFYGGSSESEAAAFPVRLSKIAPILSPFSRQETARPISKQIVRVPGASQSGEYTGKATATRFTPLSQLVEEAPLAGARPLRGTPTVLRLAGARDIEAAGDTLRRQGVVPLGPFSSIISGDTYQSPFDVTNPMAALNLGAQTDPNFQQLSLTGFESTPPSSNLFSGVVSGIDPRITTAGEQNVRSRVEGYLGGKKTWVQKNAEQANILRQQKLSEGLDTMAALKSMAETHPEERIRNKALTLTKQIDSLYDITQDPNLIAGVSQLDLSPETIGSTRTNELVQAIAPSLTLPGGEVIPTSAFYRPHRAVDYAPGSNLTQVQGYEQELLNKQITHSNTQRLALAQLRSMKNQTGSPLFPRLHPSAPGEKAPVIIDLTKEEFNSLPKATQNQLRQTRDAVATVKHNLEAAKGNELLFHIPENILEGVNMRPVFSELTGEVSGFEPVPMEKTMTPVERHAYESNKGIGRGDVGGVGRRREELQQQVENEFAPGSLDDPRAVMYKDVDSGDFVHPDEVTDMDIYLGRVRPVTGQTATAQRLLGSGGRAFNLQGTSAASFDPGRIAQIVKQHPELLSPEGLLYSPEAMVSPGASKEISKGQTKWEAERQSALQAGNVKNALFAGKMKALVSNKKVVPGSEQGTHLTSLSDDQLNETIMQAQFAGMPDVAEAASQVLEARSGAKQKALSVAASENALRQAGLAQMSPATTGRGKTTRPATRVATATEKAFGIASAKKAAAAAAQAALPESQTIPLEKPKHYIAYQESSTGERVPTWYVDNAEGYVPPAQPSQEKLLFEQATRPDQFAQTELRLPGQPGKPGVRMTSANMQAYPTPFTRWTDYIDRALTVNPQTPMQWLSTAQEKALQRPAVYQPRLF